jgi:hypothetical protein
MRLISVHVRGHRSDVGVNEGRARTSRWANVVTENQHTTHLGPTVPPETGERQEGAVQARSAAQPGT